MCVKMAGKRAALSSLSDSAISGMWHVERIPESRGIGVSCGTASGLRTEVPFYFVIRRRLAIVLQVLRAIIADACIPNKASANIMKTLFSAIVGLGFTTLFIKRVSTTTLELA
jgi:hypothetical protein